MSEQTNTTTPYWGGLSRDWLIPGTRCAWGARAILRSGNIDLVGDRQDMVGEDDDRKALAAWLNETALPGARENVKRWYNAEGFDGSTTGPFILYHDDNGTVFGTPNASYGYLYMVAFLQDHLPEGHPTRGLERYIDARKAHDEAREEA